MKSRDRFLNLPRTDLKVCPYEIHTHKLEETIADRFRVNRELPNSSLLSSLL